MTTVSTSVAIPDENKGICIYNSAGQEVKLSFQIVRNFLTRGGGTVTDQDIVQFTSICKYNGLNPFLNEAYLVKFGTTPCQMVVSKEALMKRADACDKYDGIQGGVIVLRGGEQVELEGSFFLTSDVLVGGWAKVYRSDRKYPIVARVSLAEYDKKQSTWNEKKSTMIVKVAKVQALREAFPAQLGAMYTAEETGTVDAQFEDVTEKANKDILTINVPAEQPVTVNTTSTVAPDAPIAGSSSTQAEMFAEEKKTATTTKKAPF